MRYPRPSFFHAPCTDLLLEIQSSTARDNMVAPIFAALRTDLQVREEKEWFSVSN
jgi:hypothetical protein